MRKKCGFILTAILILFAGCADESGGNNKGKFSITIDGPFEKGTISVKDGLTEAAAGETITITAVPGNYYRLVSVTVKGQTSDGAVTVSGTGNERTFAMPHEPVKVTALFQLADEPGVKYAVTIGGPFGKGTISVKDGITEAAAGGTITLIAVPDNYYRSVSVTVKGEASDGAVTVSGTGNEWTFTMPPEPVKVTAAAFDLDAGVYGITMMGQYYNGWVTSTDGNRYNAGYAREGETVTMLIVPESGYRLASITIKGKTTGQPIPVSSITIDNDNNKLTFIMPGEDVVVPDFDNGLIFSLIQ
jgi:guanyl-specific ribonuclease Sa